MATTGLRGIRRGLLLPIRLAGNAVTLAAPVLLAVGLAFVSGGGMDALAARDSRPALVVAPAPGALDDLQASAANRLEAALAKGGSGITFSIVQRSTIHARPGGKELRIPDPADPSKTIVVSETPAGALIEHGFASHAGFYAEIREGPEPGKAPDWDARLMFQALDRDGAVYRNEGKGWYETDNPPGIGLDPASIALLPGVIRNATGLRDAGVNQDDPSQRDLTGTARVADIPGLVAADGVEFTQLTDAVTYGLDPDGNLTALHLVARNTNLTEYDLLVETDIGIAYEADDLAEPKPAIKDTKPEIVP